MTEHDPLEELPWPKPPLPSAVVTERIHRSCTGNLHGKVCRSAHRRVALSLLVLPATVGVAAWFAVRLGAPDDAIRSGLYGALGWSVVLGVLMMLNLARPPGRRPCVALRWAIAIAVPVVFLAYVVQIAWASVPFGVFSHGAYASHALRCGALCFAVGALMSGGMMLLWRGTDPLTPGLTGSMLGLLGGIGSALGMGVACPSHETWHLLVSHGVVVTSLAVLGGAVGRRLLAP